MISLHGSKFLIFLPMIMYINSITAQSCDCQQNFKFLKYSIENNYIAFEAKTTSLKDSLEYRSLVKDLNYRAQSSLNYKCYLLLRNYLDFFKDPHLTIHFSTPDSSHLIYLDSLKRVFKIFPTYNVNVENLLNKGKKSNADSIEGVYEAQDFDLQVAVLKTGLNRYTGYTIRGDNIKWQKGQVKLVVLKDKNKLKVTYFQGDHLPKKTDTFYDPGVIDIGEYGRLVKITSEAKGIRQSKPIEFRKLSEYTCLVTVRSAWITYRNCLDSIITENIDVIKRSKNMIIDLRNNYGGYIMTFDTLIPIVYSSPIYTDGLIMKSSQDNINLYSTFTKDEEYTKEEMRDFVNIIDSLKAHLKEYVTISNPDSIVKNIDPTAYPEKIGIVMNRNTKSACELFILYAKQSQKVRLFGENTRGQLDFSEIVRERTMPCPYLSYTCPIGRGTNTVIPLIDNIGIAPDVYLDSCKDWIECTRKILEDEN